MSSISLISKCNEKNNTLKSEQTSLVDVLQQGTVLTNNHSNEEEKDIFGVTNHQFAVFLALRSLTGRIATTNLNWNDEHCSIYFSLSTLGPYSNAVYHIQTVSHIFLQFTVGQQTVSLREPGTIKSWAQRPFIAVVSGKTTLVIFFSPRFPTFMPFIDHLNIIFSGFYYTIHLCSVITF